MLSYCNIIGYSLRAVHCNSVAYLFHKWKFVPLIFFHHFHPPSPHPNSSLWSCPSLTVREAKRKDPCVHLLGGDPERLLGGWSVPGHQNGQSEVQMQELTEVAEEIQGPGEHSRTANVPFLRYSLKPSRTLETLPCACGGKLPIGAHQQGALKSMPRGSLVG